MADDASSFLRVLIVEPDGPRRQTLFDHLRRGGLEPVPCANAEAALEALSEETFSAAILGGHIRDVSSPALIRRIRDLGSTLELILAPSSQRTSASDGQEGATSGAFFAPEELRTLLANVHRAVLERLTAALEDSEERYRTVVEASGNIIIRLARDFRILDWNRVAEERYGWKRDEIVGSNYLEALVPPDERETMAGDIRRMMAGSSPESFENPIRTRDGIQRSVVWNVSRLPGLHDDPSGILAIGQDVTERKNLIKALHDVQHFQRRITETVPEYIYIYDLPARRTVYANRNLAHLLGYTDAGRDLGEDFFRHALHPDDQPQRDALFARYSSADDETIIATKYRMRHQRGEWRWLSSRDVVFARDAEGVPRQILGVVEDITEREEAAVALRKSREELRELARHLQNVREAERAEIAREIHDQLGQELTALKLRLSVFSSSTQTLPDDAQESLALMSGMVDNIVDSVRRIARELRPHLLEDLGLPAAIRWQAEQISRRYDIRTTVHAAFEPTDLPLNHATHLYRILQESLTNVVRHAEASQVEIELVEQDANLVLRVADDGRGITDEQIYSSRSIGLTGMRERALLCGGTVAIESAAAGGTTIIAHIPLSPPAGG